MSEFSADSQREASSSKRESKPTRTPLTPADYTEAIFKLWENNCSLAETESNTDVVSFCAQLASSLVNDEIRSFAIMKVATDAHLKGAEMQYAKNVQRAMLLMVKHRR